MSEEHLTDARNPSDSDMGSLLSRSGSSSEPYAKALKRRASPSFEGLEDDTSRKRLREGGNDIPTDSGSDKNFLATQHALANDLAQELNCGCCSELCYRPVVVSPCQHFFCGR
jgi:E3 ubiquitin-protein ligase CHFR